MAIIKKLLLIAILTSTNVNGEELLDLFRDKLNECISMGFLQCDSEFSGSNRGVFHLFIEHARLKKIQSEALAFFELYYPKSCDGASELISIDMTGDINISMKPEELLNRNDFEIIQREDGIIFYKHNSESFALIPEEDGYKFGVDETAENNFKESNPYSVYVYMRIKNNIDSYHIEDAKYNKRSCSEYVHKLNEALAPIILSNSKYKESELATVARKYLKRDIDTIANYYFDLNSKKKIYERIYSESSICMQYMTVEKYKEALAHCEQEAISGNFISQYYLGRLYFSDELGEKNYEKAFIWFEKAALQDDVDSQFALGNLYYEGLGVKQSYPDAVYWYKQAAARGNNNAAYNLATLAANGEGVKQNLELAYALALTILDTDPTHEDAQKMITLIQEQMTDGQIKQANFLAQKMNGRI